MLCGGTLLIAARKHELRDSAVLLGRLAEAAHLAVLTAVRPRIDGSHTDAMGYDCQTVATLVTVRGCSAQLS